MVKKKKEKKKKEKKLVLRFPKKKVKVGTKVTGYKEELAFRGEGEGYTAGAYMKKVPIKKNVYEEKRQIEFVPAPKKTPFQKWRGQKQKEFGRARQQFGKSIQEFGRVGLRQPEPFTQEQEILNDMFGGGSQIWGTEREPVKINHDLNPSRRGDDSTGRMFGF